jgi:DNA polymerase-3 subunit delta
LSQLLQSAHQVDGIVKGLKAPDWPADGWQALHRLADALPVQPAALRHRANRRAAPVFLNRKSP